MPRQTPAQLATQYFSKTEALIKIKAATAQKANAALIRMALNSVIRNLESQQLFNDTNKHALEQFDLQLSALWLKVTNTSSLIHSLIKTLFDHQAFSFDSFSKCFQLPDPNHDKYNQPHEVEHTHKKFSFNVYCRDLLITLNKQYFSNLEKAHTLINFNKSEKLLTTENASKLLPILIQHHQVLAKAEPLIKSAKSQGVLTANNACDVLPFIAAHSNKYKQAIENLREMGVDLGSLGNLPKEKMIMLLQKITPENTKFITIIFQKNPSIIPLNFFKTHINEQVLFKLHTIVRTLIDLNEYNPKNLETIFSQYNNTPNLTGLSSEEFFKYELTSCCEAIENFSFFKFNKETTSKLNRYKLQLRTLHHCNISLTNFIKLNDYESYLANIDPENKAVLSLMHYLCNTLSNVHTATTNLPEIMCLFLSKCAMGFINTIANRYLQRDHFQAPLELSHLDCHVQNALKEMYNAPKGSTPAVLGQLFLESLWQILAVAPGLSVTTIGVFKNSAPSTSNVNASSKQTEKRLSL